MVAFRAMDDADRTWIEKLFKGKADPDTSAADDLAAYIAAHGDAGKAAIAKSLPGDDTDPEVDMEDLTDLSDADLAEIGLARVAKSDPAEDPVADRLTAIESAIATLVKAAGGEEVKKDEPVGEGVVALVKAGVAIEAIEAAKPLLDHADKDVREAATATLLKQADPRRASLLKAEAGSAAIPTDDAEVKAGLAALAKQAGEIPRNGQPDPAALAAALTILAGGN